jgi:hypothetical protein
MYHGVIIRGELGVVGVLQEMWTEMKKLYVMKEGGRYKNEGMVIELMVHMGRREYREKSISVRLVVRGVVRWRERPQHVVVCGGRLVQKDTNQPRRHHRCQ